MKGGPASGVEDCRTPFGNGDDHTTLMSAGTQRFTASENFTDTVSSEPLNSSRRRRV